MCGSSGRPYLVKILLRGGCDFFLISAILRHSDPQALQHYYRQSAHEKRAALQAAVRHAAQ